MGHEVLEHVEPEPGNRLASYKLARNVVAAWYDATDHERYEGRRWYAATHGLARSLAETHWGSGRPRTLRQAAAIIAAATPAASWGQTVNVAILAYKQGTCDSLTYKANCEKINRLLAGEDPDKVLGGPKVRAFYNCIMTSGKTDWPCIDRHALAIALGWSPDDKLRQKLLRINGSYDGYATVAEAYRQATILINARRIEQGEEPVYVAEVQAGTWVWFRNHLEGRRRHVARDPKLEG